MVVTGRHCKEFVSWMGGYERRGNKIRPEPKKAKKGATDRVMGSSLCSLQH